MLTTRRLIEMKWNIVAVNDWYANWLIACQANMRSPRITAQEYLSGDILWSSVEHREFGITRWIYEHLCRYDYPESKIMDIISYCASVSNTNDNADASHYAEVQKLLRFFIISCRKHNVKREMVPILIKHQQLQLLRENLGHIDFNTLYPWLCANNLVKMIKFFVSHKQNQFKNQQMWRRCIYAAWQTALRTFGTSNAADATGKPAVMETIAYVLRQVGYERVNAEKDHRVVSDLDKKVTDPIIFSWLICSSPLQTTFVTTSTVSATSSTTDADAVHEVEWSKSYVKKMEKHLDEYNHLFLAIDVPDLGRRKDFNNCTDTIDTIDTINIGHLANRILELYAASPKLRQGLAKQFGWNNYLPLVNDHLRRMKSLLATHISDPASTCLDYLFAL